MSSDPKSFEKKFFFVGDAFAVDQASSSSARHDATFVRGSRGEKAERTGRARERGKESDLSHFKRAYAASEEKKPEIEREFFFFFFFGFPSLPRVQIEPPKAHPKPLSLLFRLPQTKKASKCAKRPKKKEI